MNEWQTCFECGNHYEKLISRLIIFNDENNSDGNYYFATTKEINEMPKGLTEEFFCYDCLVMMGEEI